MILLRQRSRLKAWFLLFRPWSYTATLVPFLVAAGLFVQVNPERRPDCWLRWTLGLLSGVLFQATVNLLNTWGDEKSGVDNVPGAIRTTPQVHEGLVSLRAVFAAAAVCALLAAGIGCALCFYPVPEWCRSSVAPSPNAPSFAFCYSLLAAGIVGALGATNYSTGFKFKYRGLGVPFVSFLMGPLEIFVGFAIAAPALADRMVAAAVCAAWQAPMAVVPWLGVWAVFLLLLVAPVALLVGVIMHGNDMRDIPTDRAAGIRTFASWMGPRRALGYYYFCHIGAYVPPLLFAAWGGLTRLGLRSLFFLLPLLALPLTARTLRTATRVYRENPVCPKWRGLERSSGGIHLVFGALYALAFALAMGRPTIGRCPNSAEGICVPTLSPSPPTNHQPLTTCQVTAPG